MDIPEEILLEIFSRLSLLGIIHARSVCKYWRETVLLADVPPFRLQFYNLYLDCISSDAFQQTRHWLHCELVPFDRKAYIENLERQCGHIPDDFTLWIHEWPAKAVLGGIWPGLPSGNEARSVVRRRLPGANELGHDRTYPTIKTITSYELEDGTMGLIRGLKLWTFERYRTWFILDAPRNKMTGLVVEFDHGFMHTKHTILAGSWIEWQKAHLKRLDSSFWGS